MSSHHKLQKFPIPKFDLPGEMRNACIDDVHPAYLTFISQYYHRNHRFAGLFPHHLPFAEKMMRHSSDIARVDNRLECVCADGLDKVTML